MKRIFLLLILGLILRLVLIPQLGYEADIAFWKSWSLAASDKGVVWLTQNTNYNYPAGFTFILWVVGKLYSLLADPHNYSQYWQAGNLVYLLIIKIPIILADLGIAVILFKLLSNPSLLGLNEKIKKLSIPLVAAWVFHPVVLFDGVWWGQVDTFGVFFVFLTIYFLTQKKLFFATLFITLGFLLKMQNIIFLPLFFLYVWRAYSWKQTVKSISASLLFFALIALPFSLAHDLGKTFSLIVNNSDWFPLLSLHAYNIWWLASRGAGMATSDKILILGLTNAKTLGLILFSASYFLAVLSIFKSPKIKTFIISLTFAAFSFFILPTQSHERYIVPALSLFFLTFPYLWEKERFNKALIVIFTVVSIGTLINLNNSLVANYPQNGLGLPTFFSQPITTLTIGAINSFLLLPLCLFLLFESKINYLLGIGGIFTIVISGLAIANLSFFLNNEISLTKIKPVEAQQDFGLLQTNKNLNSSLGPKNWNFLSVNYFFYRRGFATHANSKTSFPLGGHFSKFSTDIGIDTSAGPKASIIFEIYADGQLLYTSPTIQKYDLPTRVEVPLNGAEILSLVTKDAGDGITDDHADWLEPMLYK